VPLHKHTTADRVTTRPTGELQLEQTTTHPNRDVRHTKNKDARVHYTVLTQHTTHPRNHQQTSTSHRHPGRIGDHRKQPCCPRHPTACQHTHKSVITLGCVAARCASTRLTCGRRVNTRDHQPTDATDDNCQTWTLKKAP